jgi:hypothetical protein
MKQNYTINDFTKDFSSFIKRFQIDESELKSEFKRLNCDVNDFALAVFNHTVKEISQRNLPLDSKYRSLQAIYLEMRKYIRSIEGKNSNHIHEQMLRCVLLVEINSKLVLDVSIIPDNRCSYCQEFKDKKYNYDEFLTKFPIDMSKCEIPLGCCCAIALEVKRDKNGQILSKV